LSELREHERKTLLTLRSLGGRASVDEVAEKGNLAHAAVMRAALVLEESGLIKVSEERRTRVRLNDEGRLYAEEGLPERRLVQALKEMGGEAPIGSRGRAP